MKRRHTMAREIIQTALVKKYEAEIADANAKITILMTSSRIIPEHIDITGEVDKLLGKIEDAQSKMAILKRLYGIN
tara:strand:+ start:48 stop:275 length:228 start_codon:yes stop_codon:yes gene_type:complete